MAMAIGCFVAFTGIALSACGESSEDPDGGGTLRVTYNAFPDYLDPALSYTLEGWTAMYATYIPLLTYAHAEGDAGSEVIPGLAKALPEVTNGGKTYTLYLRDGLKYSDGTPVRAADFKHVVERAFELNSPASSFYTDIVGAEEFAETKRGGIAGIETDDRSGKIVIELDEPRGTFTNELAMNFLAPLPSDTPSKDLSASPPPATGPYVIVKSQPGKGWEYERNPEWEANNAELLPQLPGGHVDRIDVTVVRNPSAQVDDVERGTYDWMQNPPPADRIAAIRNEHEGTRFRTSPQINVFYFWMNTQTAPFDDPRVRQAVNYAVDPAAMERIYAGQLTGMQQILPEGMPGHEDFELYPHNLAKAKRLIAAADPADRDVTVWAIDINPHKEAAEYYEGVLGELGFDPALKVVNADNYFTVTGNLTTPNLDTGWTSWLEDYPHPNDFFAPQLAAESIAPTNNTNWAQFDDAALSARIEKLSHEQLGPEQEAAYAVLDRDVMEEAPWAPYGTLTVSTFVSDDVDFDELVISPIFGADLTSFELEG